MILRWRENKSALRKLSYPQGFAIGPTRGLVSLVLSSEKFQNKINTNIDNWAKLLYYTLAFVVAILLLNDWRDPHEILYNHSNHLWEGINLKWSKSDDKILFYSSLMLPCYFNRRKILFGLFTWFFNYRYYKGTYLSTDCYYQMFVNTD